MNRQLQGDVINIIEIKSFVCACMAFSDEILDAKISVIFRLFVTNHPKVFWAPSKEVAISSMHVDN